MHLQEFRNGQGWERKTDIPIGSGGNGVSRKWIIASKAWAGLGKENGYTQGETATELIGNGS